MAGLEDLLNPDFLHKVMYSQQQAIPQPQGQYGVPVVYTKPDVSLRGRLDLEFVFKHGDVTGKSQDQIQQLAYAAVMGQTGPGIPTAKAGYLEIWEEIPYNAPAQRQVNAEETSQGISESDRRRIIGEFLVELGRGNPDTGPIPVTSEEGDSGRVGDSQPRISVPSPTGGYGHAEDQELRDHDVGPDEPSDDGRSSVAINPLRPRKSGTRGARQQATEEPKVPTAEGQLDGYNGTEDDTTSEG